MSDVTRLLDAAAAGDRKAAADLLPLVYDELRKLAARVVELRHFTGAGHDAVAAALGITVYAALQKWTYARAWLRDAMTNDL
jgi:hypothetical protein